MLSEDIEIAHSMLTDAGIDEYQIKKLIEIVVSHGIQFNSPKALRERVIGLRDICDALNLPIESLVQN